MKNSAARRRRADARLRRDRPRPAAVSLQADPRRRGFTAGGTTDILAREVAQQMSKALGQSVVVENRPGAGGNIGTDFVGRSDADGYTLLATSVGPVAINPTLYRKLKVNPQTDLQAVAPIADVPNVLVVYPGLPVKSVQDLVAYAKAHPNGLNFGSTGVGTAAHLSGVLFNERTGAKTTHVPYKGADALNDLLAGRVQFMFATIPSVISHIRGGQLRAMAVTSRKRSSALPDVPTMAEAGAEPCHRRMVRAVRTQGHAAGNRRQVEQDRDRCAGPTRDAWQVRATGRGIDEHDGRCLRQVRGGRVPDVEAGGNQFGARID
jgi:tripartite-type tricarboxylate transporter receptor subunit TctC